MFTGIVEERGEVVSVVDQRLIVRCRTVAAGVAVGSSIAVNGVCLTVVGVSEAALMFDLSNETTVRTSLARLRPSQVVNLERPVTLASRLGGHLVQGHVDGVGEVASVELDGRGGATVRLSLPTDLRRYTIEKGSIAVDGVSLTIADIHEDGVAVALVPHTMAVTTLGSVRPGDQVNVEIDVFAKYVERLMEGSGR
jgi:riboflavin synthase